MNDWIKRPFSRVQRPSLCSSKLYFNYFQPRRLHLCNRKVRTNRHLQPPNQSDGRLHRHGRLYMLWSTCPRHLQPSESCISKCKLACALQRYRQHHRGFGSASNPVAHSQQSHSGLAHCPSLARVSYSCQRKPSGRSQVASTSTVGHHSFLLEPLVSGWLRRKQQPCKQRQPWHAAWQLNDHSHRHIRLHKPESEHYSHRPIVCPRGGPHEKSVDESDWPGALPSFFEGVLFLDRLPLL